MDKPDYIVDVAGERVYRSQSKEYYKAYTEWRNDPKNRYGYGFRHDTREHVYVDGEGFADEFASTAEKQTLGNCFKFLGISMLIFFSFQVVMYLAMNKWFDTAYYGWVYYSQKDKVREPSDLQSIVYCVIRLIAYVSVIVFCAVKLRLPFKVAAPAERVRPRALILGASVSLVFTVIGRVFNFVLMKLMLRAGIDVFFYKNIHSDSAAVQGFYLVTELLLIPALTEIVYRGYFLQLFRQFGDHFAVILVALVNAFFYHDIAKTMYVFILAFILGQITIHSGNVYVSMIIRVLVMTFSYLMNDLSAMTGDWSMRFWEIFICLIVIFLGNLILFRTRDRVVRPEVSVIGDGTEIPFSQKLRLMLYSNVMLAWMIVSLLATILSLRLI